VSTYALMDMDESSRFTRGTRVTLFIVPASMESPTLGRAPSCRPRRTRRRPGNLYDRLYESTFLLSRAPIGSIGASFDSYYK
jgi:hypothetical protein